MNRIATLVTIPLFIGCLAQAADDHPVIIFPVEDQKISGYKIVAKGRIPKGSQPFFAVEPTLESPNMWLQPRIHSFAKDGLVRSPINLGDEDNGAEQTFNVYLLACSNANPFGEAKVIQRAPKGCLVSTPVQVFRTR